MARAVLDLSSAASLLGRLGGLSKSAAKKKAARLNGRLGGRPRKSKRKSKHA